MAGDGMKFRGQLISCHRSLRGTERIGNGGFNNGTIGQINAESVRLCGIIVEIGITGRFCCDTGQCNESADAFILPEAVGTVGKGQAPLQSICAVQAGRENSASRREPGWWKGKIA